MLGVSFWITLPAAGLIYALLAAKRFAPAALVAGAALLLAIWTAEGNGLAGSGLQTRQLVAAGSVGALALFVSGLKAGLLTFGGAYTAIPFVRDDAVGAAGSARGNSSIAWRCRASSPRR